jgi:hypothetical protein
VPWSEPLSTPIPLGDGRVLVTLRDAANLFAGFSEVIIAHSWVSHAVELLLEAAEDDGAINAATVQVQRALFREGML